MRNYMAFVPLLAVACGFVYAHWREHPYPLPSLKTIAVVSAIAWVAHGLLSRLLDVLRVDRHRARLETLDAFARSLGDARVEGVGFFDSGAAVISGLRGGRRVRLVAQHDRAHLELWAFHTVATLDLTRPALPDRLSRALRFDTRREGSTYRITQRDGMPPEALERVEVERGLTRLFRDHGVIRVTLGSGMLRAERRPEVALHRLDEVFDLLAQVVAPFERREVIVRSLPGRSYGWTGGTGALRCPYCRDGISLEQAGLALCDGCRTVHHRACFAEAGGCTVLGCRGAPIAAERPGRARIKETT